MKDPNEEFKTQHPDPINDLMESFTRRWMECETDNEKWFCATMTQLGQMALMNATLMRILGELEFLRARQQEDWNDIDQALRELGS